MALFSAAFISKLVIYSKPASFDIQLYQNQSFKLERKNRVSYNKNVYQAFTKVIFKMAIHKYSHVVQNIFL